MGFGLNNQPEHHMNEAPQKTLAQALLEAQKKIGAATKGAANPFFKSHYADLGSVMEACKGPCNEEGITILQPLGCDQYGEYIETTLLHVSGEKIVSRMRIQPPQRMVSASKPKGAGDDWVPPFDPYLAPDPQAQGSAISYARRYSLQSLLFIPAKDDDGEGAMQRKDDSSSSKDGW